MSASAKLTIRASCLHNNEVLFVSGEKAAVQLYPPNLNSMDRSIYAEVVRLVGNHVEARHRIRPYQYRFELTL
jgi:hypothetical protein